MIILVYISVLNIVVHVATLAWIVLHADGLSIHDGAFDRSLAVVQVEEGHGSRRRLITRSPLDGFSCHVLLIVDSLVALRNVV